MTFWKFESVCLSFLFIPTTIKNVSFLSSTGIDSSATACIVSSMCRLVCLSIKRGNLQTISDVRKIVNDSTYIPNDHKELCARIFVTCYMGTENSSVDTQTRSKNLANDIGSYHLGMNNGKLKQTKLFQFRMTLKNRNQEMIVQTLKTRYISSFCDV